VKIDFGCGDKDPGEGWVGCDVRKFQHVAYVCDAWEIADHVEAGTVDEITSRHMLEHLTFPQAFKTLAAWRTILRPEGTGTITVPDMDFHIAQWVHQRDHAEAFRWACAGFWGWQREAEDGEVWDIHKCGWDEGLLTTALRQAGFPNVERLRTQPQHLCLKFQ